jgi:FtsP/CotA-like multicopper oxidase with cupredoxin domain
VVRRGQHPNMAADVRPAINPGRGSDSALASWAFHCHILPHAEGPAGMYGMVTALIVQT